MGRAFRETTRPSALLHCADPFTRDMARLTLRADGYHVMVAPSAQDLVDLWRTDVPDVLVMGEESVVAFPSIPSAPTIVLMALASPLTPDDARAASRESHPPLIYLAAPFSPLELARAARRARRLARPRVDSRLTAGLAEHPQA